MKSITQGGGDSGAQFMHIEQYARSASKLAGLKKSAKGAARTRTDTDDYPQTAADVLREALRLEGNHRHIQHPHPPIPHFGDVPALLDQLEASEAAPSMRKDAPILLGGVLSAPWKPGSPQSATWHEACVEFLKKIFGKNLRAVTAHTDESYDHLHFYVTAPRFGPVKGLHPGKRAMEDAKAEGASPRDQRAAYVEAMKALQDLYYEQVARFHAQTRLGPSRERLTGKEWRARKDEAKALAERLRKEEEEDTQRTKQRAELAAIVKRQDREHEERAARLDAQAAKLAAQATEIGAREVQVAAKERMLTKLFDKIKTAMNALWKLLPKMGRAELKPLLDEIDAAEYTLHPERAPIKQRPGLEAREQHEAFTPFDAPAPSWTKGTKGG
jgi:hypothetical protein